jgi:hypothetical protein
MMALWFNGTKPMNTKQSRTIGAGALLALLVLGGNGLPADDAETRALSIVTMFNGTAIRDEQAPGRPVISVGIWNKELSEDRVKVLAGLKELRRVNLEKCSVTDAGVKELACLSRLQDLVLCETKVTDEGLKHLAGLKQLANLDLSKTAVTDAGMKSVAVLSRLRQLDLGGTKITDAGLKELAALEHLDTLHLESTAVTGSGFRDLAGLKNLSTVGLSDTKVTDAGLKEVARLKQIGKLDLGRTQVTDAGLKELTVLKELFLLELEDTKVTLAGLKEMGRLQKSGVLQNHMWLQAAANRRYLQSLPLLKGELRRLRQMAYEDFEWVNCAVFSTDGRWIAACFAKQIAIWEAATGRIVRKFEGHKKTVWSVALSPDMKYLLSGSEDYTVRLWDVTTGQEIRRYPGELLGSQVVFSPDGTMVASTGFRAIYVWETSSGKLIRKFDDWHNDVGAYYSVFFSPDGKSVSASGTKIFRKWSLETGEVLAKKPEMGQLNEMAVPSRDGKRIVTGYQQGMSVREAATGAEIRSFKPDLAQNASSIAISPDGRRVVHASQLIQLWDIDSGKELWRVKMPYEVGSINFSADGKFLVSGANDGSVRIWKLPD